ncbi:hypothetical protein KKG31_02780 [Patescibacteria group bacterium]|nr:hypothetical protein [Patescibacteria group bacterium]MBU1758086.1 hypothetical protein [Patescibacteria group bacterium]
MQNHDFALAASFVASGEITAERLYNNYSTALEFHPFMIEAIGDTSAQFYVRYVDSGYVDYRKDQKTYVIKKTFVDGELHGVSNDLVAPIFTLGQFMVYKDNFISISTGKFSFATLFGAEQMVNNRCFGHTPKTQEYFSELLNKAK